uniref:Uncharacterized protein n=1 Tax=Plectus sambesii TaxID=2011161 RepID=A0A914UMU7_9BILA
GEESLHEEAKKEHGAKLLHTFRLDVGSDQSVRDARDQIKEKVGSNGIWAVVANAGILGPTGPDDWLNVDDYQKTMNVNAFGVIRMCQAFKPLVKKQKGRVVMIASVSGRTPRPTVGPYCVSKHALEAYGDVIRHELKDFGVSVHILEPGFFATNITQTATKDLDAIWERLDPETKAEYGEEFFKAYTDSRFSRLKMSSSKLDPVVDAYYHAIAAQFPKIRYWVGLDAILFYIPLATLPTFLQDAAISILRRNRPLPAAVKRH